MANFCTDGPDSKTAHLGCRHAEDRLEHYLLCGKIWDILIKPTPGWPGMDNAQRNLCHMMLGARDSDEDSKTHRAIAVYAIGRTVQAVRRSGSCESIAATSPKRMSQAGCIFFLGAIQISVAFAFLPMIAVAPMAFAGLTTMGSLCIMGSIAWLRGPMSFGKKLLKKEKLPFSLLYFVGLMGTLYATIVKRSLVLTAFFGVIQAFGLLYFLASYIPGGKACLNIVGKMCTKTAKQCVRCISG